MTTRRARDAGTIVGTGTPGPHNAITGIRVGHTTLTRGEGPRRAGEGPVRTGVTVLLPHDGDVFTQPLHAGYHWLNGNGELTGTAWTRENGLLMSPVALTTAFGPCPSWGRPRTASSTTSTASTSTPSTSATPTTPPPPHHPPKAPSAAAPA